MNTSAASFTPLESLLLFHSILQYGVGPEAFTRISTVLQNNPLVRSDDSYNADRLTSESLQHLFLHLLRDDPCADDHGHASLSNGSRTGATDAPPSDDGSTSPPAASKKRKAAAALPTLRDAQLRADQLPGLVERLYARYRDHVVTAIRDDERHFEKVGGEIRALEQEASGTDQRAQHAQEDDQARPGHRPPTASVSPGRQPDRLAHNAALGTGTADSRRSATNGASSLPTPASALLASSTPSTPASSALAGRPHGLAPLADPRGAPPPLLPAVSDPLHQPPADKTTPASASTLQQTLPSSIPPPPTTSAPTPRGPTGAQRVEPATAPTGGKPLAAAPAGQPAEHPADVFGSPSRPPRTGTHTPRPPAQPEAPTSRLQPQQGGQFGISQASSEPTTQGSFQEGAAGSQPAPQPGSPTAQPLARQLLPQVPQSLPEGPRNEASRPLVPATQKLPPIASAPPASAQQARTPGASAPGVLAAAALSATSTAPLRDNAMHAPAARPVLPEHVRAPSSRTPTPAPSPRPVLPHTPVQGISTAAGFIPRGSGTRWKQNEPTPSTPAPDVGDIASPAYEPLSPVRADAVPRADSVDATDASSISPSASAVLSRQPRNLRKPQFARPGLKSDVPATGRTRGRPPRHARTQAEADDGSAIKAEEPTSRASFDDVGEMDLEDGGDFGAPSPGEPLSRALKRKRDNSSEYSAPGIPDAAVRARRRLVGPPMPPTHVLWMRGFPKISASALDQISSHRHANMFAHKIRDRDAPGYGSIVRHPVDLKSIRMAISQGNKAAMAMAASLPESDLSGASSVWLPISEDLVPPRGIINSSQLECELVHMFANAIMYNPDSHRGPGPAFMIHDAADDDTGAGDSATPGNARYKVDEDGVVNDTRDMYVEVEKLLSEMRSAERQRGMPPPPPGAKGLDLPLDDGDLAAAGDDDEESGGYGKEDDAGASGATATGSAAADPVDAEGPGTTKRRRITRAQ